MRRPRGPGGRFLTAIEIQALREHGTLPNNPLTHSTSHHSHHSGSNDEESNIEGGNKHQTEDCTATDNYSGQINNDHRQENHQVHRQAPALVLE